MRLIYRWIDLALRGVSYLVGAMFLLSASFAYFHNMLVPLALTPLVTLIHELGHAAAVKSLKWKILAISVWPFEFNFVTGRFGLSDTNGEKEIGGYVRYLPGRNENWSRDLYVAAAGPLANLALLVICLILLWRPSSSTDLASVVAGSPLSTQTPAMLPSNEAMARAVADLAERRRWEAITLGIPATLGALSFGMAAVNLIPFKGSDGRRIVTAVWHRMKYRTGSA